MEWLRGAQDDDYMCKQPQLAVANSRAPDTWPAHALLSELGKDWRMAAVAGALESRLYTSLCAVLRSHVHVHVFSGVRPPAAVLWRARGLSNGPNLTSC